MIVDIAFGDRCEQVVRRFIHESSDITGCVAWLTNPSIIRELAQLDHCSIVVTADTVHNRQALGLHRIGVRQVGRARGRYRALMHHKFLVRLTNGRPSHVLIGSYNFTRHSNNNIGESVVVIHEPRVAARFAAEARRACHCSRPIRAHDRH